MKKSDFKKGIGCLNTCSSTCIIVFFSYHLRAVLFHCDEKHKESTKHTYVNVRKLKPSSLYHAQNGTGTLNDAISDVFLIKSGEVRFSRVPKKSGTFDGNSVKNKTTNSKNRKKLFVLFEFDVQHKLVMSAFLLFRIPKETAYIFYRWSRRYDFFNMWTRKMP